MINNGIKLIFLGILMVCISLVMMFQPLITWAQEQNNDNPCAIAIDPLEGIFQLDNMNPGDSFTETMTVSKIGPASANLYLTWDPVSANPPLEEAGNLFDQLLLMISLEEEVLYTGPMADGPVAGEPVEIGDTLFVAFMEQGDEIELLFNVVLPGPETGNQYQGSSLQTRVVFYTVCTEDPPDETIVVPPQTPEVIPEDPESTPEDPEEVIVRTPERPAVTPPLPRTDGTSLLLFFAGLFMVALGLVLRKLSRQSS